MKKAVLMLDLHDGKDKQKALKTVSSLSGIDSIAMDMKEKKLTVIGTVDPVNVVSKLRKYWPTNIILVGPAKEPEKPKEEPKKEEAKKEGEAKKEEPKKEEEAKKEEPKKEEPKKEEEKKEEEKKKEAAPAPPPDPVLAYRAYNPHLPPDPVLAYRAYNPHLPPDPVLAYRAAYNPHMTPHYHVQSIEENPNACVIC